MKKLVVLMGLLILASGAMAQPIDPDPDMVGVYFDTDATVYCNAAPALYTPLNVYLCFTNITATSGISGWEAHVDITPPPAIPVTFTLPAGALNVSSAPDFVVGLSAPMDWMPAIPVLTMTITPLAALETQFWLSGAEVGSFGGLPGYAAGDDPGDLRSCGYSGGPTGFCAVMFRDCADSGVLPSEEETWGSVKSMFR